MELIHVHQPKEVKTERNTRDTIGMDGGKNKGVGCGWWRIATQNTCMSSNFIISTFSPISCNFT